jgi:hypothetical protein
MAEHAGREIQIDVGAKRPSPSRDHGSGPASALLTDLQRTAGNRAVARLIQRQLTIGGAQVTKDRIVRSSAYKTRLNEIISTEARAAGLAPDAVRQSLVEMTRAGAHDHTTRREAVRAALRRIQEAAWQQLPTRHDVVYRTPPLTEADARRVISDVERAAPNALQGLQQRGVAFAPGTAIAEREHEWGILKARSRADECVLIVGDRTGVDWDPDLLRCGVAIAHAHPYFEQGRPRLDPVRRWGETVGRVSTVTKEIADHQIGNQTVPGAVLWSDLAGRTEFSEMLKIFPSASDVAFSAKKGVTRHTVYTPYLVLAHPAGRTIANPDFAGGALQQAARLRFEIRNAVHVRNRDYGCELVAFADNVGFWSQDIVTDGDGAMSTLKW